MRNKFYREIYNASAEKTTFQSENPIIHANNSIIQNEKLTIEGMKCAISKKIYNLSTQENLMKVYEEIVAKQVFDVLR